MSWIDKILPAGISRSEGSKRTSEPEGVWAKCVKCAAVLYRPDLERNALVCPKCDYHMRLPARKRLDLFLDVDNREEVYSDIEPIDRLRFRDKKKYTARLAAAQKNTGERDALVAMRGTLHGQAVVALAFEFGFHGGSMGQAVGEKFSRAAQLALKERIPLVCFSASGGARMQEALISLMQMAKTSAVIERMHMESVPYISVLTDPIYGGVSASLALLGDLNIAEPGARAGFAGPNIIEQTIRQKLPKGFQRSEFLLEHGAIDMIVHRLELRDTLARVLAKLCGAPEPNLERSDSEIDDEVELDASNAAIAGDASVVEDTVEHEGAETAESDEPSGSADAEDEETSPTVTEEEASAETEEAASESAAVVDAKDQALDDGELDASGESSDGLEMEDSDSEESSESLEESASDDPSSDGLEDSDSTPENEESSKKADG